MLEKCTHRHYRLTHQDVRFSSYAHVAEQGARVTGRIPCTERPYAILAQSAPNALDEPVCTSVHQRID